MPCQVGMTTDPERRLHEWENEVVGLKNWKILDTYTNREAARKAEERFAKRFRCNYHPGGEGAHGPWHVYYFEYTRRK